LSKFPPLNRPNLAVLTQFSPFDDSAHWLLSQQSGSRN
jgi:hypothetical protein